MFSIRSNPAYRIASALLIVAVSSCLCRAADRTDESKYIKIDEIRPTMQAYCLTVYQGTKVEKFGLEILSVIRNHMPGRDLILVKGTDERFIHTGAVLGASGSPVYIDGRMAGALAYGFPLSKDPLYLVTPISDILSIGKIGPAQPAVEPTAFAFDFSKPLVLAEIDKQLTAGSASNRYTAYGMTALPCPLVCSVLPEHIGPDLGDALARFALYPVAAVTGTTADSQQEDIDFEPGGCLAVPLVSGDVSMTAIGTVTEVDEDKVYALGHNYLGYGSVDLPMATGTVHTIVPRLSMSFKMADAIAIKGALRFDESTGVYGQIGAIAKTIPLQITINRYNDTRKIYNCRVAVNRQLTPMLVNMALAGTTLMRGDLPPEHLIKYETAIEIEGVEPIVFENISSRTQLNEMTTENIVPLVLLMNNPYKIAQIKSIAFKVDIEAGSSTSRIWSVDLSDTNVKPGETIEADVVLESYLAAKKTYKYEIEIPDNLAEGEYELIICGSYEYEKFLRQASPHKFVHQDLPGLIEVINTIVNIRRDRLYAILVLPDNGLTIEKAELPDLPWSKAVVLADAKRTLSAKPYSHWTKKELVTDTVTVDEKVLHITVEK